MGLSETQTDIALVSVGPNPRPCVCVAGAADKLRGGGPRAVRNIHSNLTRKHGSDRWTLCHGNFVFIQREFQKAFQIIVNVKMV